MDQYKSLVATLLENGQRHDGRKQFDYREITIEEKPIPRANGSARVKIGNTDVIAGIKFDAGTPFSDTPDEGVLMVNAELLPLANADFEPGPPRPQAIELARVVDRGIRESHCIDMKKLCIKAKEKVWMVFVDIYPINDDGNLLDASALAAVTALKNAILPKYDEENGVVLHKELSKEKLPMSDTPILTTFGKISGHLFLDADQNEEKVYDARLSISSLSNGKIAAMQKGGQGSFTQEEVLKCIEMAIDKAKELRKLI